MCEIIVHFPSMQKIGTWALADASNFLQITFQAWRSSSYVHLAQYSLPDSDLVTL